MKKLILSMAACVALLGSVEASNIYAYEIPSSDIDKNARAMGCLKANEYVDKQGKGSLELGKWYTYFEYVKAYCDREGIPMVAVYSSKGCVHCYYTERTLLEESFKAWATTHDAGRVIYCFMSGKEPGCPDQAGSVADTWMWKGEHVGKDRVLSAYPNVVLWWKKEGVNVRITGDEFCSDVDTGKEPSSFLTEKSLPARVENVIAHLERAFAKWSPEPPYAGGKFADPDTEGDRLEFEAGTASVKVRLSREETEATNVTFKVLGPNGTTYLTETVTWAANQTSQTNTVALTSGMKSSCTKDGDKLTLVLSEGGKNMASNHITFVDRAASAANPKWLNEKFDFGEWTVDLEEAKGKVAKASGDAYTLVSIQGSMWCPDCANTDRNFLDVKDGSNNKFCTWAKSRQIALVSMDIPNYNANGSTPETVQSPTLFSKKAFSTTLARAGEYPQSGADEALTNAMSRSGLGYLTRKGATDAEAAVMMKKFRDLAVTNTEKGGFHRPEDTNPYRTGVPIFVLLRKDGSVAARFTRFASVSPMAADKANFDNYIKRFEEMLELAKDSTEIENNYPSTGSIAFAANGGSADGSLSHADQIDTFCLNGVGGNAIQNVTVKGVAGSDTAEIEVSFYTTNATGQEVSLGMPVTSNLTDGVSANYTFTQAGSYFVKVKGKSITSDEFKAESANSTIQNFTISGAVVLVPQEDAATANAPAGSTKVMIRLTEGTVYKMTGLSSCAALESTGVTGYYRATAGGDVEASVMTAGGALTYQIWNPGSVGFSTTSREVKESVCDRDGKPIQLTVKRTGGKSGEIKVLVTTNLVSLADYRYVFNPTNLVWADGDESDKFVDVLIVDDLLFDGKGVMRFTAGITSSTGGDATITSGMGEFTLTVTEDDIQKPGRAFIMAAEPDWTKNLMVYAPATEGMKFWATREEGSDGLAAATLVSSVAGTKFETEDPRDLTAVAEEYPEIKDYIPEGMSFLWWSSRESGEKWVKVSNIPAGKTARITFRPVRPLGTVSASNTITIVSIADDAPGFAAAEPFALTRYVAFSNTVSLTNLSGDGKVTFAKISGTLPAGLKVAYDKSAGAMAIFGVLTAKAGTYSVVYQPKQVRSGKTVPGIPAKFVFTVEDVTSAPKGETPKNPAVAKSRTIKNLMVVGFDQAADTNRLAGLLQVTIPSTGRLSAKYTSAKGTISFASKSWEGCDRDGQLQATLVPTKKANADYALTVEARTDGSVGFSLVDPDFAEPLQNEVSGKTWSKTNPATDWKGYYTVALPAEDGRSGYLTLKMNTTSACNSGSFTVAGMYPNGTTFSGSVVLVEPEADDPKGWASLPVFKTSSKDVFAAVASILKDDSATTADGRRTRRCVHAPDWCAAFWRHTEKSGSFEKQLGLFGSYYDKSEDLGGCCSEDYETTNLKFLVNGAPIADIVVGASTVKVDATKENLHDVKVSFTRSTGLVSGSYKNSENRRISYKGIVINGWGEGCGCDRGGDPVDPDVFLPFMSGTSTTKNSFDSVTMDVTEE